MKFIDRSGIRLLESSQAQELRREFPVVESNPFGDIASAYLLGVKHGKAMQVALDLQNDTGPDLDAGGTL